MKNETKNKEPEAKTNTVDFAKVIDELKRTVEELKAKEAEVKKKTEFMSITVLLNNPYPYQNDLSE